MIIYVYTAGRYGSAGGSFLNMRNLGSQRTLVLLDGHRLQPSDKQGTVNPDLLPTALMRNVDVVTGGASAAYGADSAPKSWCCRYQAIPGLTPLLGWWVTRDLKSRKSRSKQK